MGVEQFRVFVEKYLELKEMIDELKKGPEDNWETASKSRVVIVDLSCLRFRFPLMRTFTHVSQLLTLVLDLANKHRFSTDSYLIIVADNEARMNFIKTATREKRAIDNKEQEKKYIEASKDESLSPEERERKLAHVPYSRDEKVAFGYLRQNAWKDPMIATRAGKDGFFIRNLIERALEEPEAIDLLIEGNISFYLQDKWYGKPPPDELSRNAPHRNKAGWPIFPYNEADIQVGAMVQAIPPNIPVLTVANDTDYAVIGLYQYEQRVRKVGEGRAANIFWCDYKPGAHTKCAFFMSCREARQMLMGRLTPESGEPNPRAVECFFFCCILLGTDCVKIAGVGPAAVRDHISTVSRVCFGSKPEIFNWRPLVGFVREALARKDETYQKSIYHAIRANHIYWTQFRDWYESHQNPEKARIDPDTIQPTKKQRAEDVE